VLELQGHRVHLASGREEALAFAERSSTAPDLVLSDVILSDGNGPSVVIELRARWPRLCALLMSGYVGEMLDERGLESCAADLIEKPFTPASLAQAVERALAQPIVEP